MTPKAIIKKQIEQLPGIESVELVCVEPETSDHVTIHVYFDPVSIVDRLTPEEVAQRNYKATERRNYKATERRRQINEKTTIQYFIDKIFEEANELDVSHFESKLTTFDPSVLADISHVCDAMAIHYAIDLQAEKEKKMLINELRK